MSQSIDSTTPAVTVGQKDLMSRLARLANLPLCGEVDSSVPDGPACTRAAGHDEAKPGHATRMHVAAGRSGAVTAVWT